MRIGLGTALLLATTSLIALSPSPVAAATGCDAPDTTWVGPTTPEGSASWDEPTNWSDGVPTVTSVVCIPNTISDPEIVEGTQAAAGVVALEGKLTVGGGLDVATLEGAFGELHGPGTTTVTAGVVGEWVTFAEGAVVDLTQDAVLGGGVDVWDGSRLNVLGDTVLQPDARIDSLSDNPGLFTITPTGSLTFDSANESAEVVGGVANHGAVSVTAGHVLMWGASPEDAHPDQFSTGTFTAAPEATFDVSSTELRTGARLDHLRWVSYITVPDGHTVTVADSSLVDNFLGNTPSVLGAGELVVTDGTVADARVGDSLTVTVPAGEALTMGSNARVVDQAHLQVFGELVRHGDLFLEDQTMLTLDGPGASVAGLTTLDNGPTSTLALRGGANLAVPGLFRNEGVLALDSGTRLDVGGKFRQLAAGKLVTHLDAAGRGTVRAAGPRDLAGELVVERDPAYEPPVATVLNFITSDGAKTSDDAFDRVVSPKYGTRKIRVDYGVDKVRLWVDRVG